MTVELLGREARVIKLLSLGYTLRGAALKLGLSVKTVEAYSAEARLRNECTTLPQLVGQYAVAAMTGALVVRERAFAAKNGP